SHAGFGREPERQRRQRSVPVRGGASTAAVEPARACLPASAANACLCASPFFFHSNHRCPDTMANNGFTTTIVHSDRRSAVEHGAIHKPMHPSSEYAFADSRELAAVFQGKAGFTYARQGTPTTAALESKITQMEEGEGTVSFATGMAALAATFFTLLKAGDHLISSQHIFGNTNSLLGTLADLGVQVTMVDATDARNVVAALRPETKMVFTESLANPGTQIADLKAIGDWCREENLVYVVDNTLVTPL